MRWLKQIFSRRRRFSELSESIREHLEEKIEDLVDEGMSREEATRTARREFGNVMLIEERSREVWRWPALESICADVKFALRQLSKSPGYTLTAILTLAIGVGANAAIFTLIDDAMLRSLPVERPAELVAVGYRSPSVNHFMAGQSLEALAHLQRHTVNLADLSGWTGSMLSFPDDRGTLRSIPGALVTGNALSLLGVPPYLGRLLTLADDVAGGPEGGWPVVLDYGFWEANYHGDRSVVGRHISISGMPATIVGVLPSSFSGIFIGSSQKVYMPARFLSQLAVTPDRDPYAHPEVPFMMAIGRMKTGISLAEFNVELAAASPSFMHTFIPPAILAQPNFRHATLTAQSASRGFSGPVEQYREPLLLLQGLVLLVLLLCCINLGGLQLTRIHARQHEFAVRAALGAHRGRILQQCLVESLLLAAIGSFVAAVLAWFSTGALAGFLTPAGSGEATVLRPDAHIFLLTAALALITTLLFGLAPAFLAGRIAPATLLKAKATNQRSNTSRQRIFIPAQFALALALVYAAGLFSQTLLRLRNNHAGFDPTHVMEVCAQFQSLKKTPPEIAALYRSMTDSLRSSPGIQSVAYTWITPLTGFAPQAIVHSIAQAHVDHSIAFNEVSDRYFGTIGTHVRSGREFASNDIDRSTCIVNQSAAHILFSNGSAIDDTLKVSYAPGKIDATCRVVGVVEDARYSSLRDPAPPTLYFPAGALTVADGGYSNNLVFLIRSHTDTEATIAYRSALARYAPDTAYMTFLPLSDQVDQSLGSERLLATLSSTFAVIALLLSSIGLFGVLALRVQQRTPEMGIRIAVGATRRDLLNLVLQEAIAMVGFGALAGVALAAFGSTFIRRFLYNTSAVNFHAAIGALGVLLLITFAASLLPALRAATLDPTQALRND